MQSAVVSCQLIQLMQFCSHKNGAEFCLIAVVLCWNTRNQLIESALLSLTHAVRHRSMRLIICGMCKQTNHTHLFHPAIFLFRSNLNSSHDLIIETTKFNHYHWSCFMVTSDKNKNKNKNKSNNSIKFCHRQLRKLQTFFRQRASEEERV